VGEDGLKRVRDGSCKPIPLYSYKMDCRLQAHTRPSCSVKGARTLPSHTHTHAHTFKLTRTYIQTHILTHTQSKARKTHAHTYITFFFGTAHSTAGSCGMLGSTKCSALLPGELQPSIEGALCGGRWTLKGGRGS